MISPLVRATPLPGQTSPILIEVLATGHIDPQQFDALEQQIRGNIPDLAVRLTWERQEGGFVQADLVEKIDRLLSLHPALLVCLDLICANLAKARRSDAGLNVPIVFMAHADPVSSHLIDSYAHPGHNLTGVTTYRCIDAKMLEVLTDTFPARKHVAYLLDPVADDQSCVQEAEREAATLHVDLVPIDVSPPGFAAELRQHLKQLRLDAVLAPDSTPLWQHRQAMVQALNDSLLPVIYESEGFLTAGGLMSYGPVRTDAIPQLAKSACKIIRGESAGNIPVDQPTRFEFVMNLRTPHFAEFGIQAATLRRADRILE